MIISRTPMRISLVGGGTDLPEFFKHEYGAVLSFAIDKFMYVNINEKFDGRTRVSYSEVEDVAQPVRLKHELVREALRYYRIDGLEVTTISDVPGNGSGLGSSSALMVGLVTALMRHLDFSTNVHPENLARVAYEIEREHCFKAVGKQDHWAAAYGGLHYYRFNSDESVTSEMVPVGSELRNYLETRLMLFWTNHTRNSDAILKRQAQGMEISRHMRDLGVKMRDLAEELKRELKAGHFESMGPCLDANWRLKRELGPTSTQYIDEVYEAAKKAGARGGKICGAGAGGFLLLDVPLDKQREVREVVKMKCVPFRFEERGCAVIYNGNTR